MLSHLDQGGDGTQWTPVGQLSVQHVRVTFLNPMLV